MLAMELFEDILNVMSHLLEQHQNRSPIYKHITPGLTDYGWFGGSAGYLEDEAGYAVAVESGSSLQVYFALALLDGARSTRLSGRVPAGLIEAARKRTHVSDDAELLKLALSRLAL